MTHIDFLGSIFTAFPLLIVDSMEQQVSAKYFALRFEGGGSTSLSYIWDVEIEVDCSLDG